MKGLVDNGRFKELWEHLKRWHRQAQGKQAHPTREVLYQESAVRAELYICQPPAKLKVPILVQPLAVNDDVPTEEEVEMAVQWLKGGRVGGTLGMRVEELNRWRMEDNWEKDPEGGGW